jgi:hypothetical protein
MIRAWILGIIFVFLAGGCGGSLFVSLDDGDYDGGDGVIVVEDDYGYGYCDYDCDYYGDYVYYDDYYYDDSYYGDYYYDDIYYGDDYYDYAEVY